jgi:hypothetical protein
MTIIWIPTIINLPRMPFRKREVIVQQLVLIKVIKLTESEKPPVILEQKLLTDLVNLMTNAITTVHEAEKEKKDMRGKNDRITKHG